MTMSFSFLVSNILVSFGGQVRPHPLLSASITTQQERGSRSG